MSGNIPRAEQRRMNREAKKLANPPKYGPVIIFTQTHEKIEGGKNVKFKTNYQGRTNVKELMDK